MAKIESTHEVEEPKIQLFDVKASAIMNILTGMAGTWWAIGGVNGDSTSVQTWVAFIVFGVFFSQGVRLLKQARADENPSTALSDS